MVMDALLSKNHCALTGGCTHDVYTFVCLLENGVPLGVSN
jgi:hypothetical protein